MSLRYANHSGIDHAAVITDTGVPPHPQLLTLQSDLERARVRGTFAHRNRAINIFQPTEFGHAVYEVIPWRADLAVPVLYFTLYLSDDVTGTTSVASAARAHALLELSDYWTQWVSQVEHPFTGLPVLYIHPCHTQDWLADSGAAWILWLQYFGRGVGLDI